jgi:hypothetical protein
MLHCSVTNFIVETQQINGADERHYISPEKNKQWGIAYYRATKYCFTYFNMQNIKLGKSVVLDFLSHTLWFLAVLNERQ